MPPGPEVASAHIPITADGAQARQELNKTKGAFDRFGEGIEKKTAGLRKFQGALSSTAGVLTGLIGVFGTLALAGEGLRRVWGLLTKDTQALREEARKLNETYDLTGTLLKRIGEDASLPAVKLAAERIEELEKRLDKANTLLEKFTNTGAEEDYREIQQEISRELAEQLAILNGFAEQSEKRKEQAEQAAQAERELKKALAENEAAAKAQTAAEQQAQQTSLQLFLQTLDEKQRAQAEFVLAQRQLEERLSEEQNERIREQLEYQLRAIEHIRDARIRAIEEAERREAEAAAKAEAADRKRLEEKERRERESAQRQAQALENAFNAAIANIQEAANASSLEGIRGDIRALGSRIQQFAHRRERTRL